MSNLKLVEHSIKIVIIAFLRILSSEIKWQAFLESLSHRKLQTSVTSDYHWNLVKPSAQNSLPWRACSHLSQLSLRKLLSTLFSAVLCLDASTFSTSLKSTVRNLFISSLIQSWFCASYSGPITRLLIDCDLDSKWLEEATGKSAMTFLLKFWALRFILVIHRETHISWFRFDFKNVVLKD